MPRIRCHYVECVFLDAGYCGASAVEIDPEVGCMTFTHVADAADDDEWNEEELEEIQATLPAESRAPGEVVPVQLQAAVTEVGTLRLEAIPRDGPERWNVEFDVRGS